MLYFMQIYNSCGCSDRSFVAQILNLIPFCNYYTRNRTLILYYRKILDLREIYPDRKMPKRQRDFLQRKMFKKQTEDDLNMANGNRESYTRLKSLMKKQRNMTRYSCRLKMEMFRNKLELLSWVLIFKSNLKA